jgi:hypothetical protein
MSSIKAKSPVAQPSISYQRCAKKWKMVDDLCGGTRAMREARTDWLPRELREEDASYNARVDRSILYGALRDTIDNVVSKPFSKPIVSSDDVLDERLMRIEDSVDRRGQSLTSFGAEIFKAAIKYRYTYVLVDYPAAVVDGNGNVVRRNVGQERAGDIRPYFVHIKPTSMLGIRYGTDETGREIVTQARIHSTEMVEDGEYGDIEVERIVVWTTTEVVIYESVKGDGDKFVEVDRRSHTYKEVPIYRLDLDPEGGDSGELPFEDLAWLNIAHWQSMSDQRNILRVARVPMILAAGFDKSEIGDNLTVSASRFFRTKNPAARLEHVEHSGKAIEAGENDLRRLEERMIIIGLQPLVQNSGTQTATGKAIDQAQSHTMVQAWIRETEGFLLELYRMAARWLGPAVTIPETFKLSINNDFGYSINAAQDVANLIKARMAGELSRKTFLQELKRRGFLSDGIDINIEMSAIEEEAPAPTGEDFPPDPSVSRTPEDDEEEEEEDDAVG